MSGPRVIIAGTSSGSGKTTAVCAILTLLRRRGADVRSFKCGPDYIDPMFHRSVLGVECMNLDPFFCCRNSMNRLLAEYSGRDITVIEGVMGYYDGTGPDGTDNSTFTAAARTRTPVILAVSAKGTSSSALAVIDGFLRFVPESMIKGVIFERVSKMTYMYLKELTEKRFRGRVVPVGYIPELPEDCVIPSRHLGLVTAGEIEDISGIIGKTADICADTVDLDKIVSIAETARAPEYTVRETEKYPGITVAVAYDRAFCFYYRETFDLLRRMGASISYFSPLDNEPVPCDADGLMIGGGYPELYAERLEANTVSKNSVAGAVGNGMPTVAECGGFQYLGRKLDGREMCGVLPHESFAAGKLVRFGYVSLKSKHGGLFGDMGVKLKAHEFHYWDSTDNGDSFTAVKPNGKSWDCAVMTDTMYAGYPHLYLYSNPDAVSEYYKKCLEYKERKK